MTKSKKTTSKRRKRRTRKYSRGGASTLVSKRNQLIPDIYYAKLKYVDTIDISGAAIKSTIYVANSLYDTFYAAGGHAPYGFDQIAALYKRYRVTACKIKVIALLDSASTPVANAVFGIYPTNSASGATTIDLAMEATKSKYRHITAVYSSGTPSVTHYQTTRSMLGLTRAESSDQDFAALMTASPTRLWYYDIWAGSMDGISSVDLKATVELIFYCKFSSRVNESSS